jgi:hypothetical protein
LINSLEFSTENERRRKDSENRKKTHSKVGEEKWENENFSIYLFSDSKSSISKSMNNSGEGGEFQICTFIPMLAHFTQQKLELSESGECFMPFMSRASGYSLRMSNFDSLIG